MAQDIEGKETVGANLSEEPFLYFFLFFVKGKTDETESTGFDH